MARGTVIIVVAGLLLAGCAQGSARTAASSSGYQLIQAQHQDCQGQGRSVGDVPGHSSLTTFTLTRSPKCSASVTQRTGSNDHPRLPPNAIETLVTLVTLVTAGELDSELPLLYSTIGGRMQAIEAARLANALARLSIGDRVRIGHAEAREETRYEDAREEVCRPDLPEAAPVRLPAHQEDASPSTSARPGGDCRPARRDRNARGARH